MEDPARRLWRIQHLRQSVPLHPVPLDRPSELSRLLAGVRPDEVYNLAAQSFVGYAPEEELAALDQNVRTTYAVLSSVRDACPHARVYFAGSSEMFGRPASAPQNEATPFQPRSAYGVSKCTGFYLTRTFREMQSQARRAVEDRLARLLARAKRAGVRAGADVREGLPADQIGRAARRRRADLIVVGTHGRSGFARAVLGSVAARVVTLARCPVLTVRGR
jgi:nucleotide-binding universal stress UspA family protein